MEDNTTIIQNRLYELNRTHLNYQLFQSKDFYETLSDILGIVGYFISIGVHLYMTCTVENKAKPYFAISCIGVLCLFYFFCKKLQYNGKSQSLWDIIFLQKDRASNKEIYSIQSTSLPRHVFYLRVLGHACLVIFFLFVFFTKHALFTTLNTILFIFGHLYLCAKLLLGLYELPGAVLVGVGYLNSILLLKSDNPLYYQRFVGFSCLFLLYLILICIAV